MINLIHVKRQVSILKGYDYKVLFLQLVFHYSFNRRIPVIFVTQTFSIEWPKMPITAWQAKYFLKRSA